MEAQAPYTQRFSRQFPGLFVILLDQSASMREAIAGDPSGLTKADYATTALNNLIFAMTEAAGTDDRTGRTKKLIYISVLGYNDVVAPLLGPTSDPIDLTLLSERPRGVMPVQVDVFDSQRNQYTVVTQNRPYWIEPRAEGRTQMARALMEARNVAARWVQAPPEPMQGQRQFCFPPVIVNITDAEDNGDGNPVMVANELRQMGTLQGATLIFNCHFTRDMQQPYVFPGSPAEVAHLNPLAAQMFEMSSVIPDSLREKAREVTNGRDVPPGARTFVYNADANLLVRFLRWGTIGTAGFAG